MISKTFQVFSYINKQSIIFNNLQQIHKKRNWIIPTRADPQTIVRDSTNED